MAHVLLFHSVIGLRPAVLTAAERLRAAGHTVLTPDLFEGVVVDTVDEGFELLNEIGPEVVQQRARQAAAHLPGGGVLAGLSMGASFAQAIAEREPRVGGLLLLHGTAGTPRRMPSGLDAQLHVAAHDEYESADAIMAWELAMARLGTHPEVFTYPGGHLFTDDASPDYDASSSELTWERCLRFLAALS